MKPCSTLVVGVSGQDGYFLAEYLNNNHYLVHGIDVTFPREQNCIFKNIDISNYDIFSNYLKTIRPDKIFYLSAIHGGAGFNYEDKINLLNVNTVGVHVCLEYARTQNLSCTIVFASSILALKENSINEISEKSEKDRSNLYGISKNAASDLIDYYRINFNILASTVWLSNHESNLRNKDFFSHKIVKPLKLALKNQENSERMKVNSLDFWKDWGCAKEFMMFLSLMSEKAPGVNYIMATGKPVYARDLVKELYEFYGFNYTDFIDEASISETKRKNVTYIDISNLKGCLEMAPKISGLEVFKQIIND